MKTISAALLLVWLNATAVNAQSHCTTPATIVAGVECNLVSTGTSLLLPCTAPIGFYNLPVGTPLLIDYTPSSCVSFCQQGTASDIFCAQVEGGQYFELCAGQSLSIGLPGDSSSTYYWEPQLYISCTDCPTAVVSPPSDAIYKRTEIVGILFTEETFYNIEVITCTGTEIAAQNAVTVYPVPALEEVQVRGFDFDRFAVFDTQGSLVLSGSGDPANTIRVGSLPAGLYLLRLWNKEQTMLSKFLKAA